MPNCFSLTRKGESEPTPLATIDAEICNLLNEPIHPKWYCIGWFDIIGYALAMGKSFADIRKELTDNPYPERNDDLLKITDYLDSTYVSDAWAEIGRRR